MYKIAVVSKMVSQISETNSTKMGPNLCYINQHLLKREHQLETLEAQTKIVIKSHYF